MQTERKTRDRGSYRVRERGRERHTQKVERVKRGRIHRYVIEMLLMSWYIDRVLVIRLS